MTIDSIIFLIYLIITLILGLFSASNVKNIKDYALGGRNFSNISLIATVTATWVSGSGFFITISKTYSDGLYYLIASCGFTIQLILMAYFLVPKMQNFLGKISIAEAMGEIYGNEVRIIIAIVGAIGACGLIAVQFKAFGIIFANFYGLDSKYAIILASIVVTFYSAVGGIKAVTVTDVLQFFTFIIAIPIIIYLLIQKIGVANIGLLMQSPKFNYKEVINFENNKFLEMIPLILYFSIPTMGPTFTQRISIGKDLNQVKYVFICSAFIILFLKIIMAIIPIIIFNINPNLNANNLLSYIIDNYTITGIKGLLIIAVVAMAMSTADSYINSSAVIFANDFCGPLKIFKKHIFLTSKVFAFFLGGVSLILALQTEDMLKVVMLANSFYMPVATPPILITILGFHTIKTPVLVGMIAGFTTTVIWHILKIPIDGIVIAMAINLIFMLTCHYYLKIFSTKLKNNNLLA